MGFLRGRMNRATYWSLLGVVAVLVVIGALVFHAEAKVSEIVLVMVCVPRLHDIGRSGWIAIGVFFAEVVVIFGAALALEDIESVEVLAGVMVLVLAGLLIWLGCVPGDRVSNAYGGQPGPGIRFGRNA